MRFRVFLVAITDDGRTLEGEPRMELVEGAESRNGGSKEGVGVWSALGARGSRELEGMSRSCGGESGEASSVRSMILRLLVRKISR